MLTLLQKGSNDGLYEGQLLEHVQGAASGKYPGFYVVKLSSEDRNKEVDKEGRRRPTLPLAQWEAQKQSLKLKILEVAVPM